MPFFRRFLAPFTLTAIILLVLLGVLAAYFRWIVPIIDALRARAGGP